MTMTREKIEELKRLAKEAKLDITPSLERAFAKACAPTVILDLLALAERALEPQGQALPVHMVCYQNLHGPSEAGKWREVSKEVYETFAPENRRILYASQLALPAGPVPIDERIKSAIRELDDCEAFDIHGDVTDTAVGIVRKLFPMAPPSLPAGPVPEKFYAVLNPSGNEGVLFKDKMDAEYTATGDHARFGVPTLGDTFRECYADDGKMSVREVVLQSLGSPAVAQPVADEREAFEKWCKGEFPGLEVRVQNLLGTYTKTMTEWLYTGWQARAALCQPAEASEPVALKTHGAWDGLETLDSLPDGTELHAKPVQGSSTLRGSKFGWPCQPAEEGDKA